MKNLTAIRMNVEGEQLNEEALYTQYKEDLKPLETRMVKATEKNQKLAWINEEKTADFWADAINVYFLTIKTDGLEKHEAGSLKHYQFMLAQNFNKYEDAVESLEKLNDILIGTRGLSPIKDDIKKVITSAMIKIKSEENADIAAKMYVGLFYDIFENFVKNTTHNNMTKKSQAELVTTLHAKPDTAAWND